MSESQSGILVEKRFNKHNSEWQPQPPPDKHHSLQPQPHQRPNKLNAMSDSIEKAAWTRGGRQFATPREIYTRSLYRICLKFTTSEDEDEGKPEPATAYWTVYGRATTVGNGGPSSPTPDDICRRMDDSMTGPAAGVLSRLTDFEGEQAASHALRAGMTTGWHIRGDRGDAAIRVGRAKILVSNHSNSEESRKEARLLSLDAERWVLSKGASFAAGNSVFNVEDVSDAREKITIHCSKGAMRGKLIDIYASRCPFVFGRAHEADLCIMDRELSRKHGAILFLPSSNGSTRGGSFVLADLESTVRRIILLFIWHFFLHVVLPVSCILNLSEWIIHEAGRTLWSQRNGCVGNW